MATAWLCIAAGQDRQHGGNDGYDDIPSQCYRWDDTVPHHGDIRPGDTIALWDKRQLLGASVIEEIRESEATKLVRRCPRCAGAHIKPRKTLDPRWRCFGCSTNFDDPVIEMKEVDAYESRHEVGWVE